MIKYLSWLLLILIIYIIYGSYIGNTFEYTELKHFAEFGDSFGVLTSFFAGLTFFGLIITIHLQKQEIKEMKNNVKQEEFEKKFFYFLNVHNDLVSKFRQINSLDNNERYYMYGGEAISFFLDKFKEGGFYSPNENLSTEVNMEEAYKDRNIDPETLKRNIFIKLGRNNLKFIDNIYIILSLIDNENLSQEKQLFYINSILAQISDEELILIFYYTHALREDMKILIEKFAFFESIDEQLLHNWEEEIKLYEIEAYGEKGAILYNV
jgi:hypothetical protein